MDIRAARTLQELREVLYNTQATGPETVYWVFTNIKDPMWENMTVTTPGLYDKEYPKTYGHYHTSSNETEVYKLINGTGIFLLQKKMLDETGKLIENKVSEVILVEVSNPGDEIIVPKEYGHSWSNIGDTPLITFDNWRWGHKNTDYVPIKNMQGMAYYITEDNGKTVLVKNEKYIDTPEPKWISAKEFNNRFKENIVSSIA